MKLNEISSKGMSLETQHGVRITSLQKERPTSAEAKKALEADSPVLYAKKELKVSKEPDSTSQSVLRYLEAIAGGLKEAEDMSELDPTVIGELEKKIREGAKDTAQQWANALELVHKAYSVLGIQRPTPGMSAGWSQYEGMISFAVKELSKARGLSDDKWRMSAPSTK